MISVEYGLYDNEFILYWQDKDGNNSEYITKVYGFENAVSVAKGISHEQAEYVKHMPWDGSNSQTEAKHN